MDGEQWNKLVATVEWTVNQGAWPGRQPLAIWGTSMRVPMRSAERNPDDRLVELEAASRPLECSSGTEGEDPAICRHEAMAVTGGRGRDAHHWRIERGRPSSPSGISVHEDPKANRQGHHGIEREQRKAHPRAERGGDVVWHAVGGEHDQTDVGR